MKPPIQSRTDLATWIESCVLGDLRTLLLGVDSYYASSFHVSIEGRPLGSANFLLVAGCCSALDYFAFLFKGRGSNEANVKAFIERFLQRCSPAADCDRGMESASRRSSQPIGASCLATPARAFRAFTRASPF
jgi:hypothetical protein